MKKLGIIGGLGPESTVDYYRSFIAAYRSRINDGSYSFIPHSATDTAALIEFDVKSDGGDTAVFALGRALAPLGHPRLGPQFGVYGGLNAFMIRGASEGAITVRFGTVRK